MRFKKRVSHGPGEGSLVTAAAGRKEEEEERKGGRQRVGMKWELKGWRSDERAERASNRDYGGWST